MPRPIANPPNPWSTTDVEWLGEPPDAKLEIYEERSKTILSENDSPDLPMRWSLNPYRGCFHGCAYCLGGDTPILLADGTSRRLSALKVGDEIFGTASRGGQRAYTRTKVLAHWQTRKPAFALVLDDGEQLIASGDHRFLSGDGWRHAVDLLGSDLLGGSIDAIAREREVIARPWRYVVGVERLGAEVPMFDITTGTSDFIANGVVSHNCYARPSHQYWGFGAGTDFERNLVVKVNAPELLRATFMKKSWQGESITFSGNTDCYQPLEAAYRLTRQCLEVCLEFRNPVHIITKGALVRRDVDLIAELAKKASAGVTLSIPFADDEMGRKIEPYASKSSARFEAMRVLADAGVEVSINIAPVIPGLNDPDVPELLERAHAAGARRAGLLPVRLSAEVLPVFMDRLKEEYPGRVAKVTHALLQIRSGKMNDSNFGARMTGQGPRWEAIRALFEAHCKRLGMNAYHVDEVELRKPEPTTFRRPSAQGSLFD